MISHLETEVKRQTFKINLKFNPCNVIGRAEPRHRGSEPADSAQFHKGSPFMSTIFLTSFLSL